MSEDMSDMIQKMSEMLKNNEIPDNVKSIMSNLASGSSSENSNNGINNNSSTDSFEKNNCKSDERSSQSASNSFDMSNIDINTMLKMKSVIDSMNQSQNDPRSNLLKSLKPYLKTSRREKVDQYIKLFSMGKAFELLNPLGGEKKNDV